jgi:hypothetical protein
MCLQRRCKPLAVISRARSEARKNAHFGHLRRLGDVEMLATLRDKLADLWRTQPDSVIGEWTMLEVMLYFASSSAADMASEQVRCRGWSHRRALGTW